MIDILETYLKGNATPELQAAMEEAHAVLEEINFQGHEEVLQNVLMTSDNADPAGVLTTVTVITESCLVQCLGEHGIVFDAQTPLEMYTAVVKGILALPDYENQDELARTCLMDSSPEELFAELMRFVTDQVPEELLVHIRSVDTRFLALMQSIAEGNEDKRLEVEDAANRKRHTDALSTFCDKVKTFDLEILQLLTQGMAVGYPFLIYMNAIGRDLETMTEDQAANELIAMALLSCDGIDNPRGIITQHIEHYVSDVDVITRIDVKISDKLLEMTR